jgi:hypothetical protein
MDADEPARLAHPEGMQRLRRLKLVGVSIALVVLGCDGSTGTSAPASTPARTRAAEAEGPAVTRPSSTARTPAPVPVSPVPTAVEIPDEGTGSFALAAGEGARLGSGSLLRYTVEVEGGLPYGAAGIAWMVDATLADPRSWIGGGEYAFQRTDGDGDIRVLLASPATTDQLCAPLRTRGEVSCRNSDLVVINARRWAYGIEAYGDDLAAYRQYVVNHEMGHAIGLGHVGCPGAGQAAPVMLQQTYGMDGCTPNPWPYP